MKDIIYRTVVVSIGDDCITYEIEQPEDMNEDELYEMVCDAVLSNIDISVY